MNNIQLKVMLAAVLTGVANKYLGKFLPPDMIGQVVDALSVIIIAGVTGFFFTRNAVVDDVSKISGVKKIEATRELANSLPNNDKVTDQ